MGAGEARGDGVAACLGPGGGTATATSLPAFLEGGKDAGARPRPGSLVALGTCLRAPEGKAGVLGLAPCPSGLGWGRATHPDTHWLERPLPPAPGQGWAAKPLTPALPVPG